MKKTVFIFGAISGIICVAMFVITFSLEGAIDFEYGQILGYATMVIAFSTIFFAVRAHRDKQLGGSIAFGKAFLIGLYITLVASLIYVVGWEFYYTPEFIDKYAEYYVEDMKNNGMTEAEINKEMEWTELYKNNTFVRMGFTLAEIFPVGLIISLICAAILRKKPVVVESA
ncbi:MAG: DUF4199 domain-containing protein [Flavobacteriales bacterium]|nr:DUF4199 domain-containing protein [Bacteroidales bacterium AH-315-I05]PCJ87083.1 MAG: DUF4199 domain-containing protein [Flavobacteriales bacterium]